MSDPNGNLAQNTEAAGAWVHCTEIPAPCAQWLDPDRPLDENVQFLPHQPQLWLSLLLSALFGSALVVLVAALIGPHLLNGEGHWELGDIFLLLLGMSGLGYISGQLVRKLKAQRQWAAGRWRRGVFLGPEDLLIHLNPKSCFWLPKAWIQDIQHKRLNSGAGTSRLSQIEVHYLQAGESHFVYEGLHDLQALQNWMGTEKPKKRPS